MGIPWLNILDQGPSQNLLFNCLPQAAGHREVAPRELMCILGGSPRQRRREKKEKKKNKKNKKNKNNKKNKKGRRRQSRKTEAACVARFAVTTYWPYTKLVPPPAK